MTTQDTREKLVEEVLRQIEPIRDNTAPTVSRRTTLRQALDHALTTYGDAREAAAREGGAQTIQAVMDTAVMLHEQEEMTDTAFCKLRDLLHAAALTPNDYPANN